MVRGLCAQNAAGRSAEASARRRPNAARHFGQPPGKAVELNLRTAWIAAPISVAAILSASLVIPHALRDSPVGSAKGVPPAPIPPDKLEEVLTTVATKALQPEVGNLQEPSVKIADDSGRRLPDDKYDRASFATVTFVSSDSAYTLAMEYSASETAGLDGESYCMHVLDAGISSTCEASSDGTKITFVETRQVSVTFDNNSIRDSEIVMPGEKPILGGQAWTKRMVSVVNTTSGQRTSAAEWLPVSFRTTAGPPRVSIATLQALAANPELVMKEPSR